MRGMTILSIFAVLAGGAHGALSHKRRQPLPDQKPPAQVPSQPGPELPPAGLASPALPPAPVAKPKPKPPEPEIDIAAELAAAKEFIAKAALPSAGRALDQAQGKMPGPKGRVAVSELRDELALLRTLTAIVPTNAFADASNIYAVRLPAGDLVVAKVPNAADEKAESLTIKLRDGRQLSIRRSRIQSIKPVAPQEFRRIVMRELRARERELGKDPNPVEAFRTVVSFCLEYGMRVKAMTVLQAALRKPAGSVLVALFCEVEARRHRRTQARLAGIKEPNLLAALSIDRPEPVSVNEPSAPPPELTPSPSAPAPAPQARPQPKPIRDKPDVMEDSRWTKAGALYKRGIDIYRGSFSGSSKSVQKKIHSALKVFQDAQDLLAALSEQFEDDQTVERRAVEIQQLIYDCLKRQKI